MSFLSGIRVLDLGWLFPGPYCSMVMANMGAEVIKIEPPNGDPMKTIFPDVYQILNRDKKIHYIDLNKDISFIQKLLPEIDIFIENFRPGRLKKFDLDFKSVSNINKRIVYASIYGFGSNTSLANHPGHDLSYQAISGLPWVPSSLRDTVSQRPQKSNFPLSDVGAGLWTCIGILGAMQQRDVEPQYVEIAMADVMVHFADLRAHAHLTQKSVSKSWAHLIPTSDFFETKDGCFIALALVEDKFWKGLCSIISREDLLQLDTYYKRAANGMYLIKELDKEFYKKRLSEWETLLSYEGIPYTAVNQLYEVQDHDYVKERGLFYDDELGRTCIRIPINLFGKWL